MCVCVDIARTAALPSGLRYHTPKVHTARPRGKHPQHIARKISKSVPPQQAQPTHPSRGAGRKQFVLSVMGYVYDYVGTLCRGAPGHANQCGDSRGCLRRCVCAGLCGGALPDVRTERAPALSPLASGSALWLCIKYISNRNNTHPRFSRTRVARARPRWHVPSSASP